MAITKKPVSLILSAIFGLFASAVLANPTTDSTKVTSHEKHETHAVAHDSTHAAAAHEEKELTPAEERKEFIQHHLLDSHDFTLFSYDKESGHEKHFGFSLPVILWEDGLHIFSSAKFEHETAVVESNGKYFKIEHGLIYNSDKDGHIDHEAHLNPLKRPLDLSITKNVLMMIIVGFLMILLFTGLAKSYKKHGSVPKGIGRFFEPIIVYIRDEIAIPNIGEKNYRKYMPFLLTIFFFVWFLNMFGLTPLGVNVTGNIAVTAALAILVYLITTLTAKKDYWLHILWMPGVPTWMKPILAPIELLGTIIKPFSLTIRLYANILAGHVVLMSIIALMYTFNNVVGSGLSFFLAFVLSLLEILVALLQAYVFTMLSALYFGAASEEHHHDDHH
ncbi:F0F1 ATP synthase subunit A [Flavobacterium amniphilum]|uniref:F0F1 ATP synthase subunit A n=1 Tax=Flavobacterium amniphilum TaxID=1834035 RepID=UPI00202A1AF8|nr:F0F1 ATP synthase subunit A [Flavobacterium amniphilum]MCL9804078.1 F0F1 ATP synthase subunit A [Flavobacterium amniphilum]